MAMQSKLGTDPRYLANVAAGREKDFTADARVKEAFDAGKDLAMTEFPGKKWGGWQPDRDDIGVRFLLGTDFGFTHGTYYNTFPITVNYAGANTTPWVNLTTTNTEYKVFVIVGMANLQVHSDITAWKFVIDGVDHVPAYLNEWYGRRTTRNVTMVPNYMPSRDPYYIFDSPLFVKRKKTLKIFPYSSNNSGVSIDIHVLGFVYGAFGDIGTGE